jgi:hypothetical protein
MVLRGLIHAAQAILEGALLSVIVVVLVAGTALAAKGGGQTTGTTSSLVGPVMVLDANGNRQSNYGDEITFTVTTTASQPEVGVRCWQGTTWMYDAYVSYFNSWLSPQYFLLTSTKWDPAVIADCTARLFYYNKRGQENVLATLKFSVAP